MTIDNGKITKPYFNFGGKSEIKSPTVKLRSGGKKQMVKICFPSRKIFHYVVEIILSNRFFFMQAIVGKENLRW